MQDHFTTPVSTIQNAMTGAVRTWAESVQRLPGVQSVQGVQGVQGDLTTVVDAAFDLAEQVLAAQREIVKAVLRAATP